MNRFSKPLLAFTVLVVSLFGPVACGATESAVAQDAATPVSASKKAGVLSISTTALPAGVDRNVYLAQLQANGGTPGYTWTISSGNLPSGFTLIPATGLITGTPKQAGTSTFTLAVSDKGKPIQTVTKSFSITTLVPLAITTSAPSSAINGLAYRTTMQASGGMAPYTWSIASGLLPAGLILNASTGEITGTPKAGGVSTFSVAVIDHGTLVQNTSKTFSITTLARLAITTTVLSSAITGSAYASTMQATGGVPAYTWSVSAGALPSGLTLNADTGAITGTPTGSGTTIFTETVTDHGSPVQSVSQASSINTVAQLTVPSAALPAGTAGTAYAAKISVSGGAPAYTWSITSGILPNGLTMAATTGVISGNPTVAGTFNFAARVVDNGATTQTLTLRASIKINPAPAVVSNIAAGTTWYVRVDGGTRYSSNVPSGQCDGKGDAAYSGVGVNQHCAFSDFRYMWDDDSGVSRYQTGGSWVIAGGDTVIIRGCAAGPNQTNAANPNCRIGWDRPTGGSLNNWCYYVDGGSYACYNPPIPAGTAAQPTRILGQNYASCNVGGAGNPKTYASNLAQIFGGYSVKFALNLSSTQYVNVQCMEITTHNGACLTVGSPAYPRGCSTSPPLDDYGQNGILTNNQTSNILLQDVYIHGFNSSGLQGPIGGPITMNRVFIGFNTFAGWNFDDGNDTADASGSQILASYVSMIGNGCSEQYPVVNAFPAQACYDSNSAGFGDAWSGQDTTLDVFTCDHCVMEYNTKDGFIGPHTQVAKLTITNSVSIGNMGAQWKWGTSPNASVSFLNNLTVMNCRRMQETLSGASHSFAADTGLGGSYLTNYCRGAGNGFSINTRAGSTNVYSSNTVVAANATVAYLDCGYYTTGNTLHEESNCGTTSNIFTDNVFLGYTDPGNGSGQLPGLWYPNPGSNIVVTSSYNAEYGLRNGDICGSNGIICTDPRLINEPDGPWPGSEKALDAFDPFVTKNGFAPLNDSPLVGSGLTYPSMPAVDYAGKLRTTQVVIGALIP